MPKPNANETGAVPDQGRDGARFLHHPQNESSKSKSNLLQVPSITLPQGGGAIKSIDEKFSVNAANGTASFSIPLPLSPGRGGVTPALSLGYNSGSGNSIFGLGWNCDYPSIQRKTEKKLPEYRDEEHSDTFIFSGAEDLVPEPDPDLNSNTIRYRPRIEGLFSRVEKINDNGNVYWKIRTRENVVSVFGQSDEAKLFSPVPGEESRIFKWCLDYSYDDKGNVTRYFYKRENNENVPNSLSEKNRLNGVAFCTNLYLKKVLYGNTIAYYEEDGELLPEDFVFELVFDYGEHDLQKPTTNEDVKWRVRKDPFSDYRAGFETRTYRLCERILMFHHFRDELGWDDYLVRSMDFGYDEHAHLTYLETITQTGYIWKGDRSLQSKRSLPPLQFGYAKPGFSREVKEISRDHHIHAPVGLDNQVYQWTDLYSEGISGILTEQATGWFYKANLGDGTFSPAKPVSEKPSFTGLGEGTLLIQELEANSKKYLVKTGNDTRGFFELTEQEEWEPFKSFEKFPNIDFRDPNLKMLDLNGDGMPDLLISRDQDFVWYASKGKLGYDDHHIAIKAASEEQGPRVLFANEDERILVATADMNGDGLADILVITNTSCAYYPNLGYGAFGAKVTMQVQGCFDEASSFNPRFLHLTDIDGSGTTDIVYIGKNKIQVWYNESGNSLRDADDFFNPFPAIDSQSKISFVDLLGNGTSCLVWSSSLPAYRTAPLRYIDLTNGRKPHVMERYVNNMGKEVRLEYTSSTKFYLRDKKEGKKWITKLPFPVQCVSKVIVEDKVAQTRFANEYSYHHGYYDSIEREFRGFALVVQKDSEQYENYVKETALAGTINTIEKDLFQAPVITKTWFHTGAFLNRDRIFHLLQDEYYPDAPVREGQITDADVISTLQGYKLQETSLPADLSADEMVQCCRALKGLPLRQEVYSDEGGDEVKIHPYTVTQHNYDVQVLQRKRKLEYAVFFSHEKETLTFNYERNPLDPRIAHAIYTEIDAYGNVLEAASIVYGRRKADATLPTDKDREKQARQYVTYTVQRFTQGIDVPAAYRLPVGCESKMFELNTAQPAGIFFTGEEIKKRFEDAVEKLYEQEALVNEKRKLEHSRTYFLRNDLSGAMPLGMQDTRGLPFENYLLAFTPTLIQNIYGGKFDEQLWRNRGMYLRSEGDDHYWIKSGRPYFHPDLSADPFIKTVAPPTAADMDHAKRHFFLPVAYQDNFGNLSKVVYDKYKLFITRTIDAVDNETNVDAANYRVVAPYLRRDANNNRSAVRFDELGLVTHSFVMGKEDEFTGDPVDTSSTEFSASDQPSSILEYEFRYFESNGVLPNRVKTTIFEKHYYKEPQPSTGGFLNWLSNLFGGGNNAPVVETERKTQVSYSYSDGSGHEVLKKIQAEPGEAPERGPDGKLKKNATGKLVMKDTNPELRWIGSGRTILNNKGKPVKQYEPYFDSTPEFNNEAELLELGFTPVIYYDAAGRVIRTEKPDGTYSKVVFDAWQQKTYDENDTAGSETPVAHFPNTDWYTNRINGAKGEAEQQAAHNASVHYNTPSCEYFDSLGRPFLVVAHNKTQRTNEVVLEELYYTRTELDVEGNARSLTDARGNVVMSWKYDMLGNICFQRSMDAGDRWMLANVMGKPLRLWDSRGHVLHYDYDAIHRPTYRSVHTGAGETRFEQFEYGENVADAAKHNLRGKLHKHFDTAGVMTSEAYDYKANLLVATRQLLKNYKAIPDWKTNPELETTGYTTETAFDALNRPVKVITPDESIFTPGYNETNLLETLDVTIKGEGAATNFVQAINYNAKGQRLEIFYGNQTRTGYVYEPETYRLVQMLTTADNGSRVLQDLQFTYDPVGNIVRQFDNAQKTIFYGGQKVEAQSDYYYDAVYRLIEASGREHPAQTAFGLPDNWNDDWCRMSLQPNSAAQLRNYKQKYFYDAAGNIMKMQHVAGGMGNWTRTYQYNIANNQLLKTMVGSNAYNYSYNEHGSMLTLAHLSLMDWNFREEMQRVGLGGGGEAFYVYDSSGQRVRKIIERAGGRTEERIYLGPFEIYRERTSNSITLERETLHVMDDTNRIALIDTRTRGNDRSDKELIRYQYSNHLGSAALELDGDAKIISYEEYHPYGTTAFQATDASRQVPKKRYRYAGVERDDETGFINYGARMYLSWLGRWLSTDPHGLVESGNLYAFCLNSPVTRIEQGGHESVSATELRRASKAALAMGRDERVKLMNELGGRFGIPTGGFATGQSRIFQQKDIRLFWLMRTLSGEKSSAAAETNLTRAKTLVPEISSLLLLTTAARENDTSVTETGNRVIETWSEGGLDFLWQNRHNLGLPQSMIKGWKEATPFISPETGNMVHPGLIPAKDQLPAYAAQTRSSYQNFEKAVLSELGTEKGTEVLGKMSEDAKLVWMAYSFMAPGGVQYDPKAKKSQHGQKFGVKSALGYLIHKAKEENRDVDLNEILTDPSFHQTDYIKIAKARAVEAVFLRTMIERTTEHPLPQDYDCVQGRGARMMAH